MSHMFVALLPATSLKQSWSTLMSARVPCRDKHKYLVEKLRIPGELHFRCNKLSLQPSSTVYSQPNVQVQMLSDYMKQYAAICETMLAVCSGHAGTVVPRYPSSDSVRRGPQPPRSAGAAHIAACRRHLPVVSSPSAAVATVELAGLTRLLGRQQCRPHRPFLVDK